MDNGPVLEDEFDSDMNVRLVSLYLFAQIKKNKPEWFEEMEVTQPCINKKKRKKKLKLHGNFIFIATKNNDSSWEDNLADFVVFEKNTRVYN